MESLKHNKTKCVNNGSLIFSQVGCKQFHDSVSATCSVLILKIKRPFKALLHYITLRALSTGSYRKRRE
jgi:hypothetical protein